MKTLGIDIETYCEADLGGCGVYKYAEHPTFRLLLFGYSVDGAPARVVDVEQGEAVPAEVLAALADPAVEKTAFNALFERTCLGRWFCGRPYDPQGWRCTMARAARLGFPGTLDAVAAALRVEGKMDGGRALVQYFSRPRLGKRRLPGDSPERWESFKEYNRRDVEAEQAVLRRVERLEAPEWEERLYVLDQRINDRGVAIDGELVRRATGLEAEWREALTGELRGITGLDNPNSLPRFKEWLSRETMTPVATLTKADLPALAQRFAAFPRVRRALEIRRELGKASVAKYRAMEAAACADGRARGLLQYYGAARTGRWAGRLIQVQNMPQNHLPDLDRARQMVLRGDRDGLELGYESPAAVLSELTRTALCAPPGKRLLVCDYSAVEARVTAWLAGEEWALDVFRAGGDLYCATASQMFGVPVEKHGANAHLRQRGKVAVLALGYGGGVPALEAMGAGRMGLMEHEMRDIVERWREANPHITALWRRAERAAKAAARMPGEEYPAARGVRYVSRWGVLMALLPSGRALCYPRARVGRQPSADGRRWEEALTFEGVRQATRQWGEERTYGGKLVENLVQGIARDLLARALLRAEEEGLRTVLHVHDEIVVEAGPGQHVAALEAIFRETPPWAPGLPLEGAGYETPYYRKD